MASLTDPDHLAVCRQKSLARRARWSQIKRDLKSGRMALGHAMLDPEGRRRPLVELVGYSVSRHLEILKADQTRPDCDRWLASALLGELDVSPQLRPEDLSMARRFEVCTAVLRSPHCIHRHRHQAAVVNAGLAELARVA